MIPADFAAHATEPISSLCIRYRVTNKTVTRWRRQLGVKVPPGAPKGNRNRMGGPGHTPRKRGCDDPEAIRTCLNCTAPRCHGKCYKVH